MRVGYVTPELPYPPDEGGKIVAYNRIHGLADRGHRVSLFSTSSEELSDEALSELKTVCERVVHARRERSVSHLIERPTLPYSVATRHVPSLQAELDRAVDAGRLDAVVAEHTHVAPYVHSLSVPTFLSVHNVEYATLLSNARSLAPSPRAAVYTADAARMLAYEWNLFRTDPPEACLFVSKRDCEKMGRRHPSRVDRFTHLPAGVEVEPTASTTHRHGDGKVVTFTGTMRYPPNVEAVQWFVNAVLPVVRERHPDVEFRIVGKSPTESVVELGSVEGVTVTGRVDDVTNHLTSADVSVVPVREGGGTQLKLLEALGAGNPTVSTSFGVEGTAVEDGEHVLVADEPTQFAEYVSDLLDDTETAAELASNGRRMVDERYSVQSVVDQLETTLERRVEVAP